MFTGFATADCGPSELTRSTDRDDVLDRRSMEDRGEEVVTDSRLLTHCTSLSSIMV